MSNALAKHCGQMMQSGQDMARVFNPALETMDPQVFEKMVPPMSAEMLDMWFGRTFNREGLDALTMLSAQAEPQLRLTVRHAVTAGATAREGAEAIWQTGMFACLPGMQKALEMAQGVFAETEGKPAA